MHSVDLTLVGGFPGTGKSTISRALSTETGASYFDKDDVNPLSGGMLKAYGKPPSDRSSKEYVEEVRPLEYEVMIDMVMANIRTGRSCVANAPFGPEFSNKEWRISLQQRCNAISSLPVTINYVWLELDGNALRQQLEMRGELRDQPKLADWDNWFAEQQAKPRPLQPCFILDVSDRSDPTAHAYEIIENFGLPSFPRRRSRPQDPQLQASLR